MATLNVKNVPDKLYERLEERAKSRRRSLSQEVIQILTQATEPEGTLSIMELQGLGKEIWKDIDPDEYVKKERESWD
jgi:plasmid stability protein